MIIFMHIRLQLGLRRVMVRVSCMVRFSVRDNFTFGVRVIQVAVLYCNSEATQTHRIYRSHRHRPQPLFKSIPLCPRMGNPWLFHAYFTFLALGPRPGNSGLTLNRFSGYR